MKFLLSFCFLVAFISLTWAKSITWGKRLATDELLYRENVVHFPVKDFIQEIYVSYPKMSTQLTIAKNVTAIVVYDRFANSSGALPIKAIPVHKTNNTKLNATIIILQSQRSRGINSTVEFYGK